jgi:type VI secretion system protein ImpK
MSERAHEVQDVDATIALPTPGRRRMAFAPALERHAAAADVSALGGLNRLIEAANPILALVPQIRHSLRHPDPSGLRARLREQLGAFERGVRAARIAEEHLKDARYALCALIDDSASATPWGRDWPRVGFLAKVHGEETGAERFFALLEKLLATPELHTELLEFFYVCLALGFEGRYRGGEGGRQALTQIRARLYNVLAKEQASEALDLSGRWLGVGKPARHVPKGLALWSMASVCALLLAGLYSSYSISLGALSDPVARELARLKVPRISAADATANPAATARRRELGRAIGLREVDVREAPGGVLIVLKADELFASGSARLHTDLEPAILRVAEVLNAVPGVIVVTGHTDDLPIRSARFPSNWELSAERARSVLNLMRRRVHDAARLRAEGLADSDPAAPNDSAANRARNRRVAIVLRTAS